MNAFCWIFHHSCGIMANNCLGSPVEQGFNPTIIHPPQWALAAKPHCGGCMIVHCQKLPAGT